MQNILKEHQCNKYLSKKEDISNYDESEDQLALHDIHFTLHLRYVADCTTAHEAWEKICSKYLHSSKSNVFYLRNQFLGMKMKENEHMEDFVQRVNDAAEQLSILGNGKVSDNDKS